MHTEICFGALYLVLVDALDGDALIGLAVDGSEGVAELAVSQQLPECVPRLEVLVVAEVRPLPARNDPPAPAAALPPLLFISRGASGAGSAGRGAEAHLRRRRSLLLPSMTGAGWMQFGQS